MLKIITDLLCLMAVIVFITDLTDFPLTVKKVISFILMKGRYVKTDYRLHLVDCSLCQTFWLCNIYLIATGNFNIPLFAFVCLLAYSTTSARALFLLLKDIIDYLITTLDRKL